MVIRIVNGKESTQEQAPVSQFLARLYFVTRGALNEATVWRCANETCPSIEVEWICAGISIVGSWRTRVAT